MASPSSESIFSDASSVSFLGANASDLLRGRVYIQVLVPGSPSCRKSTFRTAVASTEQSSASRVEFILKPPTIKGNQNLKDLSKAVYNQWLSKHASKAWMLGCPEIQYDSESNIFALALPETEVAESVPDLGVQAALDIIENVTLTECLAKHLTEGGDDRLHLSAKTLVNKYFCPPRCVPDEVIQRSSCTCSPPSRNGFPAASNLLQQIWQGSITFDEACEDIRTRMKRALRLQIPYEIVLHPSGSDAEILPLAVAIHRARQLGCSGVVNIVVAAGEVGSGTAPAAGGRHFNKYTPNGRLVTTGTLLTGFPAQTTVIEIKPRKENGSLVTDHDDELLHVVENAQRQQPCPFFVVHAVDGSKTGLRLPSQTIIDNLRQKLKARLLIVLDACQGRSDAQELEWYLARDALILVTASKFFGAPGFCGAVLVPNESVNVLANQKVEISGLGDYITQFEVPRSLKALRDGLPEGPENIGLLLRWACGVTEMERFTEMGSAARHVIRRWVEEVERQVKSRSPCLELLDCTQIQSKSRRDITRVGGFNSVVSIKIRGPGGSPFFDVPTLRRIHHWLTMDASNILPDDASNAERHVAAVQCFVGQPVLLGDFGVLRLAMGAPLASDLALDMDRFDVVLKKDEQVLEKMMVLAKYCKKVSYE